MKNWYVMSGDQAGNGTCRLECRSASPGGLLITDTAKTDEQVVVRIGDKSVTAQKGGNNTCDEYVVNDLDSVFGLESVENVTMAQIGYAGKPGRSVRLSRQRAHC